MTTDDIGSDLVHWVFFDEGRPCFSGRLDNYTAEVVIETGAFSIFVDRMDPPEAVIEGVSTSFKSAVQTCEQILAELTSVDATVADWDQCERAFRRRIVDLEENNRMARALLRDLQRGVRAAIDRYIVSGSEVSRAFEAALVASALVCDANGALKGSGGEP